MTVFVLRQDSSNTSTEFFIHNNLDGMKDSVSDFVNVVGFINSSDFGLRSPPEHLPEQVEKVFQEGARCRAIGCWNAAGAMFRTALDLTTKGLLPENENERPNARTCRNMGLRLPWLFENGLLPSELSEISDCVKEDGNDGVHDGTLTKDEVEDLYDFTVILLQKIFTEPKRIELAAERRVQRRQAKEEHANG